MKFIFFFIFQAFLCLTYGNIIIPQPSISCSEEHNVHGCPRGQYCIDNICHPPSHARTRHVHQHKRLASPAQKTSEPKISPAPIVESPPDGGDTIDGTCGSLHHHTICGKWPKGSCCSMYGFCGSTSAHCGTGCQSGPCYQTPVEAVPEPKEPHNGTDSDGFELIGSSGVPAMHAALLPNGRVVLLDKVENYTELKLANGQFAYSSEYDPETHQVMPLAYKTNAFCSGGTFLYNGSLLNIGGNLGLEFMDPTVGDGLDGLRYLDRSYENDSMNGNDWVEPGHKLASPRWYASTQILGDGKVFVASGSLNGLSPVVKENNNPTYEILDVDGRTEGRNFHMDILYINQPYYMYPFVHLLRSGEIFIFASKASQIFNITGNKISKELPDLPGDYRTYPNTGGSVLLPLSNSNEWAADIIICGGGAYQDITSPTDPSCGRISPEHKAASWEMDSMPQGRGMVEGVLLADGKVLWVNGASSGAQGFGLATDPALTPFLYDPEAALGERWTEYNASTIPRLYHSVALMLLDGSVLIAGSNPVEQPILEPSEEHPFITEFRVERWIPPYLSGDNVNRRPTNVNLHNKIMYAANGLYHVAVDCPATTKQLKIAIYHGGFVTHSLHMGQRMLFLERSGFKRGSVSQNIRFRMPPSNHQAPPGTTWVLYVLCDGIPSMGQFFTIPINA